MGKDCRVGQRREWEERQLTPRKFEKAIWKLPTYCVYKTHIRILYVYKQIDIDTNLMVVTVHRR